MSSQTATMSIRLTPARRGRSRSVPRLTQRLRHNSGSSGGGEASGRTGRAESPPAMVREWHRETPSRGGISGYRSSPRQTANSQKNWEAQYRDTYSVPSKAPSMSHNSDARRDPSAEVAAYVLQPDGKMAIVRWDDKSALERNTPVLTALKQEQHAQRRGRTTGRIQSTSNDDCNMSQDMLNWLASGDNNSNSGPVSPPFHSPKPQQHSFTQIPRNQMSPSRSRFASVPPQPHQSQISPPPRSRTPSTPQQQNHQPQSNQTPARNYVGTTKTTNSQSNNQLVSPARNGVTSSPSPQSNSSPIRSRIASAPTHSTPRSYNQTNNLVNNGYDQKGQQTNGQNYQVQPNNGSSPSSNKATGYSFNATSYPQSTSRPPQGLKIIKSQGQVVDNFQPMRAMRPEVPITSEQVQQSFWRPSSPSPTTSPTTDRNLNNRGSPTAQRTSGLYYTSPTTHTTDGRSNPRSQGYTQSQPHPAAGNRYRLLNQARAQSCDRMGIPSSIPYNGYYSNNYNRNDDLNNNNSKQHKPVWDHFVFPERCATSDL